VNKRPCVVAVGRVGGGGAIATLPFSLTSSLPPTLHLPPYLLPSILPPSHPSSFLPPSYPLLTFLLPFHSPTYLPSTFNPSSSLTSHPPHHHLPPPPPHHPPPSLPSPHHLLTPPLLTSLPTTSHLLTTLTTSLTSLPSLLTSHPPHLLLTSHPPTLPHHLLLTTLLLLTSLPHPSSPPHHLPHHPHHLTTSLFPVTLRPVALKTTQQNAEIILLSSLAALLTNYHYRSLVCTGRPVNGTVSTSGRFYFPRERVAYKCLEGFVLFGAEERTCQKNGTWSDQVPLCDFNLARGKRTLQSATLWSYAPEMAVDGNPDTCSFTPRGPQPRWWQVHLGHKFNVISVGVTISPGSVQEFTIYGVFQTHKALFHCNDGLGHPGQFVYIRDDREEQEYFGLCEVEVFAFRERIPCGEPEVPVEGEVVRQGETKASYTCRSGFRLEGDPVLTCSSKGKWEGQTPRCKESQCPAPEHVSHGFIEVANFHGVYGYGTVATYTCSPGYVLYGNSTRTCDHTGHWTNESPTCQAVTCGSPPVFPHARHTLINGSTNWNGIAVYTCSDGYRLHRDTGDTVTTCMDIGAWRFINVTCVPIEVPSAAITSVRRGEGRALTYDLTQTPPTEPQGTQSLVVALAVVAGLLTAAMLVVGTLLARRHLISGPGSLRSLVRSTPTKDATLYGVMVGPRHHDASATVSSSSVAGGNDTPMGVNVSPVEPGIRSSMYQQNILANLPSRPDDHVTSITESEFDDDPNYAHINGQEPPYERVRTRSEHSYETLRKKSLISEFDSESGSGRELGDKDSVGYESVKESKGKEAGYEVVKEKDHDYETLKEKDPGYETVEDGPDHGYETVRETNTHHGYETLKPKPPPPRTGIESPIPTDSEENVPDILQNLASETSTPVVPPEILALYAHCNIVRKIMLIYHSE
ncbi:Sushi, von Willebrand factor type A, EGF and pentraxin domain-containing protein 1-like 2, partial [Homarus americanus]